MSRTQLLVVIYKEESDEMVARTEPLVVPPYWEKSKLPPHWHLGHM